MSEDDVTTIQVSHDTWEQLHRRKSPGQSFDDVIQGLLDEVADDEE